MSNSPPHSEILVVRLIPDAGQQFSLHTTWSDPAAWGILIADLAKHAAKAYEGQDWSFEEALARIKAGFDAEWTSPSDSLNQEH